MRISDWSSDVCSSDLRGAHPRRFRARLETAVAGVGSEFFASSSPHGDRLIGIILNPLWTSRRESPESGRGCPADGWGAMDRPEKKPRDEDQALFLAQTEIRHLKDAIRALRDELERMRIEEETGIRQAIERTSTV